MVEQKTPFLGCAYYPEDWDEKEIAHDIEMMKKAGISCARIAEFAWRRMEPKRGKYDFTWLHHVVDELKKAGISVVMGTPTATPPIWLSKQHPEVLAHYADGTHARHGGRRHCCSNNPDYLAASDAIVEKLAQEFGEDENVIGWQLDNEIYVFGDGCICPHCMKRFHSDLAEKYGTIENLNARWDLNLFSQAYDEFDDIPCPTNGWHNPHIKYEWYASHYQADIDFMHRQAEILRKYTKAPIGTDMMPFNGMSYEDMTDKLDVVMFNHYNEPKNLNDAVFWFDFLRTLKERPFWNTETATTWNGSTDISQFLKPEGYCRVNSWLPVALGAEANMYWLFRQHWAGHELVHGSVITPEGRPVHAFGEIRQTAREYDAAAEVISNTHVSTPVAIHFTSRSWKLFEHQKIFKGNDYCEAVKALHAQVMKSGIVPDVIGSEKPLDAYKILFSPMVMTLEDRDLTGRIRSWVENGGIWIAGPMTDIRNDIGAHYTDRAMGMLEEMLGITMDYQLPSDGSVLTAAWSDGTPLTCGRWIENYTVPECAEILASVTGGHSALTGETIIADIPYGKGRVILLGTLPSGEDLRKVIFHALEKGGVAPEKITGSLVVAHREGNGRDNMVVLETECKDATLVLAKPMKNVLTGEVLSGTVNVKAYDVMVLTEE